MGENDMDDGMEISFELDDDELCHLDAKTISLDKLIDETCGLNSMLRENQEIEDYDGGYENISQFVDVYDERIGNIAKEVFGSKKMDEKELLLIKFAVHYAIDKYSLRKRKRGELFFQHSLRVARKIKKIGGNIETVVGGLLHDVIEEDNKYRTLKKEYRKRDNGILDLENEINVLKEDIKRYRKDGGDEGKRDIDSCKKTIKHYRKDISKLKREKASIVREYHDFKKEYLDDIRTEFSRIKKSLRLEFDVESIVDIVSRLTKDIEDYYYHYQQKMFVSEGYKKESISKEKLLRAARIITAKGCDREDNIETMDRLDDDNPYSFSTQERLRATYKNITTINKMRNFLADYSSDLDDKLDQHKRILYPLFSQLLEKTKEEVRKDIDHLKKDHVSKYVIKKYRYMKNWDSLIEKVIEKYDTWLHYTKKGLSDNKEDFEQQYLDALVLLKVLDKFDEQKYRIKGFRKIKARYENGNK